MLASTPVAAIGLLILTLASLVTATLITAITTIISQVADLVPLDTAAVGTLEVGEEVGAGPGSVGTESHVVLVAAIPTVVSAVAHLVARDALVVGALELVHLVAGKVSCKR